MKEAIDTNKLTLIHGNGSLEFLEPIKKDPKENTIHILIIKKYLNDHFKEYGLDSYIDNYSICYNAAALLAYLGITVFINISCYSETKTNGGILFLPNNITPSQNNSIIELLNQISDYRLIIMYFFNNEICYTRTLEKNDDKIEKFEKILKVLSVKQKTKIMGTCLKNMPLVNMDKFYC